MLIFVSVTVHTPLKFHFLNFWWFFKFNKWLGNSSHGFKCFTYTKMSSLFLYINLLFVYLFIYLWLHWVSAAARRPPLAAVSRGHSSLQCMGLSLRGPLPLQSTGSRRSGLSSCSTQTQQLRLACFRAQAQQLWRTGPAAPRHVGSPRTRARTPVPRIGRQTPNHCATREAPKMSSL